MTKLEIGPSTGWMYARGIYSLSEHEEIIKNAGANSAKICLKGWDKNDGRVISLKGRLDAIKKLAYRSLHIPNLTDNSRVKQKIRITKSIARRCAAAAVVTHPIKIQDEYPIGNYEMFLYANIPLSIENMDSRNSSGIKISELEKLIIDVGVRFVLDVQHAYEHDSEMSYANDLFEATKNALAHLHVSGETEKNIHSLVFRSRNAKKILAFVEKAMSEERVPLILEGEYSTASELCKEIKFIKRELGFTKKI